MTLEIAALHPTVLGLPQYVVYRVSIGGGDEQVTRVWRDRCTFDPTVAGGNSSGPPAHLDQFKIGKKEILSARVTPLSVKSQKGKAAIRNKCVRNTFVFTNAEESNACGIFQASDIDSSSTIRIRAISEVNKAANRDHVKCSWPHSLHNMRFCVLVIGLTPGTAMWPIPCVALSRICVRLNSAGVGTIGLVAATPKTQLSG